MDNYEIWYNMKNNSLTFPDFSTKIFTFPDFPWLSLTTLKMILFSLTFQSVSTLAKH